jgi:hypothetical protein
LGTKNKNKRKTPPTPPLKGKTGPIKSACSAFPWLHEISISKIVCHHFWARLMARGQIWGHNVYFKRLQKKLFLEGKNNILSPKKQGYKQTKFKTCIY